MASTSIFPRQKLLLRVPTLLAGAFLAPTVPSHAQTPPELVGEWSVCDVALPGGIAWHPSGHIVLASNSQKVVVFTPVGAPVRSWGSGGSGPGQFNGLSGVAVGDGGTLFTSEGGGRRIQHFRFDGGLLGLWDTAYFPTGIAADGAGYFYFATAGDDDIFKFAVNGTEIDRWSCHECWSVSADHQGHIYAGSGREVVKFTTWGGQAWVQGLEVLPTDDTAIADVVGTGASGRVYASDPANNHTLVFSGNGSLLRWWSPASHGFAEDDHGRLYSVEGCTMRIYSFETTAARASTWGRLRQIYR